MNTYEMEGFLRGQCVPRDLLVNESNAEYLVRKLSEIASVKADRDALAERVNALAVENACLVRAITDHKNSTHFCERCGEDDPCATDDVCSVLRGIPDTDSAIAAFEAQGWRRPRQHLMHFPLNQRQLQPRQTFGRLQFICAQRFFQ